MILPPIKCGGCRKCCIGDTVLLVATDDPAKYKTVASGSQRALAKGKDGNCVYLGKRGCQIHGRQPAACRIFDCRKYAQLRADSDALPDQTRAVLAEGRKRLAEVTP